MREGGRGGGDWAEGREEYVGRDANTNNSRRDFQHWLEAERSTSGAAGVLGRAQHARNEAWGIGGGERREDGRGGMMPPLH